MFSFIMQAWKNWVNANKEIMQFDDFYWHDSVIKNIEINRATPGVKDIITFEIDWHDRGLRYLVFEDVYYAQMTMNFGVIADECIDLGFIADENDSTLTDLYKKWRGYLDGIKLYTYVIKTISTASEIRIVAKGFREIEKEK